jgi:hypothetical protein
MCNGFVLYTSGLDSFVKLNVDLFTVEIVSDFRIA